MNTVTVGVCAYNEERNIQRCLDSILVQERPGEGLLEVIVVCSGCTDRTEGIVIEYSAKDPRVRLISQPTREGKNSAVNLLLANAEGDVLVLVNADNTLEPGSLRNLTRPFEDPQVGMVGGHPIPVNSRDSVTGFAVHMLWDMHHRLSLVYPKVGELVAFRLPQPPLPTNMQSDEDIIRMNQERKGLRTVYATDAIVRNKGPTTVWDFIKQRTRVNIGEKYMKKVYDYDIPTWNINFLMTSFSSFMRDNRRHLGKMMAAMALEGYARTYATLYVLLDRGDQKVWSQVSSTKDVGSAN